MSSRDANPQIYGTSEMAGIIRSFFSSDLAVAPSPELCTLLNMILASPLPMQIFWGADMTVFYNDALVAFLRGKHPAALGQPARTVWAEAWPAIGDQLHRVLAHGDYVSMQNVRIPILQNGVLEEMFWDYTYTPLYGSDGVIAGVLVIAQNTTEAALAQRALKASKDEASRALQDVAAVEEILSKSQEQLAIAVDAADLATWYYDPARNVVGGDGKMARLFGLFVPEGPAELWIAAIHEEDRERVGQEFAASVAGAPYDTEYRVVQGESFRWIRAKARLHGTGTQVRMVGICEDISKRKLIEEALRSTAERLQLAQSSGNIATWEWDIPTGSFIWSGGSERIYGRPPAELNHIDRILPHIHPDDLEAVKAAMGPSIAGKSDFRADFRVCWPDTSTHWIQGFGKPILDASGKPTIVVGINMDITDRKISEEVLIRTEKLAAVGRLASSISHEINNPLEAVTNLLYLARSSDDPGAIHELLGSADAELRRVAAITNQTLRFHKQSSLPQDISCLDLFSTVLTMYEGKITNANIIVEKRKRANKPVLIFEGDIRQVLNNLIGNAIDAMPTGGRLLIRSREATHWKTGKEGLVLTVADTGMGISPQDHKHIFEAFFTTKGNNGTGLGLWISKEIVERHRGQLRVRSSRQQSHRGTVFTLFIPFDAAAKQSKSAAS